MGNNVAARMTNERVELWKNLPLKTPFTVGLFVGDICNFKCNYCIQSLPESHPEKKHLVREFMPYEYCVKVIDSLKMFPNKIKNLTIHGNGEPTLNPDLPKMIEYVAKSNTCERIQIITNGTKLTPELSKKIIDAGLTRIIISIQGVTEERYSSISRYNLDMQQFLKQLEFLYEYSRTHGNGCKIHIKTVDVACDEGEEEKFYEMFEPYADTIHIDNVMKNYEGVDYSEIIGEEKNSLDGGQILDIECCPNPFFSIYVQANGDIIPCCIAHQPIIYGNVSNTSVYDVWNSDIRDRFLKLQLNKMRKKNPACKECGYVYGTFVKEDYLDPHTEEILEKWEK